MALNLRLTDEKFWRVSPYLAEHLSLKDGEKTWLYVGRNRCKVCLALHDNYTAMGLYREWAGELGLSSGRWKVRRVKDGIRLGPVIGIVCKKLPTRPPAESTWPNYLGAIDGGRGILLTPSGFDPAHGKVHGLTLAADRLHWVEGDYPWPDALYVRTYPVNSSFKGFLRKEFPYSHFNSETLLNKWTVSQILLGKEDLKPYLPETALLNEELSDLPDWVEKYGSVYVKPCLGHKGYGVTKISKIDGNYLVEYRGSQQNQQLTVPLGADICKESGDLFAKGQYIVQRALTLTRAGVRAYDFRALMQKKNDGLWHITGFWGRMGASGSIVTNVASGGEVVPLSTILDQGQIPKSQRIKEIYAVCFKTALALEQELGMLGEIGLDLCIDNQDRLWLLEVNGMPGKNVFPRGSTAPLHKNIYASPMHYAAYLGGFSEVMYPLALPS